jgi:hypothetical protein
LNERQEYDEQIGQLLTRFQLATVIHEIFYDSLRPVGEAEQSPKLSLFLSALEVADSRTMLSSRLSLDSEVLGVRILDHFESLPLIAFFCPPSRNVTLNGAIMGSS